jgi:tRNA (guanine-N(7)-)-methyltransferase subunit TRM82
MPKRPCSIAVTPDDKTILCGDKFGDVYNLPLHASESSGLKPPQDAKETPKVFKPSASELTVHTKKNRMTLQNQLRTAQQARDKPSLGFENKVILGHVSLLTDLKYVLLPADQSPSAKSRNYLLTSDRDEHIRVSRGLPQSYITELYCQGHTEFVSKLCVPDWQRDVLISGGGDSFLLVWRWPMGSLLQKVDLNQPVLEYLQFHSQGFHQSEGNRAQDGLSNPDKKSSPAEITDIAVTGIWAMQHTAGEVTGELIVSCEG